MVLNQIKKKFLTNKKKNCTFSPLKKQIKPLCKSIFPSFSFLSLGISLLAQDKNLRTTKNTVSSALTAIEQFLLWGEPGNPLVMYVGAASGGLFKNRRWWYKMATYIR